MVVSLYTALPKGEAVYRHKINEPEYVMTSSIITQDTKYQEQVIEYKFLSDLMLSLAKTGKKLELLRVHTDSFGYDVILKVDNVVRFIQLKSRASQGKAQYWDIYKSLLENKDGRVIIIFFEIDNDGLSLNYNYLPLQKYAQTLAETPKYKKDSATYCKVSYKNLDNNKSIDELSEWLFSKLC